MRPMEWILKDCPGWGRVKAEVERCESNLLDWGAQSREEGAKRTVVELELAGGHPKSVQKRHEYQEHVCVCVCVSVYT